VLDCVDCEQPTRTAVLLVTVWQCRSQICEFTVESFLEPPLKPRNDRSRTTGSFLRIVMIEGIAYVEVSLRDIKSNNRGYSPYLTVLA
jgi:hypothetical protein